MIAAAQKIEYLRISAREHPSAPNFALKGLFNINNGLMWKETLCDKNGPCYGTKCDCYSNRAFKFSF